MLNTKTAPTLLHVAKHDSHVGAGAPNSLTIEGLRHSGMESEHGQTMLRVLRTICAPRLCELARHVDLDRAQQVQNGAWNLAKRSNKSLVVVVLPEPCEYSACSARTRT